ncbi:MAG: hypothetical protein P4L98_00495 [Ancalomicrobiaceae bacterium]|nr:hypothetical protein [Ancalomicrobiaceae bacterium]
MRRYLQLIPLTLIPLIVYLIVAFLAPTAGAGDTRIWDDASFTMTMLSGGKFTMQWQHVLLSFSLIFLFIEILKATRQSTQEIYDHMLSMIAFIIYLVLFITVARCSHAVFFILMVISLIDVVSGFLVSMVAGRRSLQVENGTGL